MSNLQNLYNANEVGTSGIVASLAATIKDLADICERLERHLRAAQDALRHFTWRPLKLYKPLEESTVIVRPRGGGEVCVCTYSDGEFWRGDGDQYNYDVEFWIPSDFLFPDTWHMN